MSWEATSTPAWVEAAGTHTHARTQGRSAAIHSTAHLSRTYTHTHLSRMHTEARPAAKGVVPLTCHTHTHLSLTHTHGGTPSSKGVVPLTCQVPEVALAEHLPAARRCAGHHQGPRDRPSRERTHERGCLCHLPLRCGDTRVPRSRAGQGDPGTLLAQRLGPGWKRAHARPASSPHPTPPPCGSHHAPKQLALRSSNVRLGQGTERQGHAPTVRSFPQTPPTI